MESLFEPEIEEPDPEDILQSKMQRRSMKNKQLSGGKKGRGVGTPHMIHQTANTYEAIKKGHVP